ncbi:MAG TPA: radical SAM protein [Victivallales bacterium]|nr:radical SAM protein [Victivallales bacterium]
MGTAKYKVLLLNIQSDINFYQKTLQVRALSSKCSALSLKYLKTYFYKYSNIKYRVDIKLKQVSHEIDTKKIVSAILAISPQVVGFSCYIWNFNETLELIKPLKEQAPNLKIILGGPEVSTISKNVLKANPSIDYIVRGEGEETFKELIECFLNENNKMDNIDGITYRKNGRIKYNHNRRLIENLDTIPSIFLDKKHNYDDYEYMPYPTSRGCPFGCRYCAWGAKKIRYISYERMEAEIKQLYEMKSLSNIYFADADIFMDKNRGIALLNLLEKYHNGRMLFFFDINPDSLDLDLMKHMSRMHRYCCYSFGLQSTNNEVRKVLNRPPIDTDIFRQKILDFMKICPGLNINIDFIYGLPGDTPESYKKTMDFALSLNPTSIKALPLLLLTGSEFFEKKKKYKISCHRKVPRFVIETEHFSRKEVIEARKLSGKIGILYALDYVRIGLWELHQKINGSNTDGLLRLYEEFIDYLETGIDLQEDRLPIEIRGTGMEYVYLFGYDKADVTLLQVYLMRFLKKYE